MLFTDVQRSVRLNKKKKSTNTSPYPDEVIDRLARAFYPAILACWNSEEGQREFSAWQAEQAHHNPSKEKQSVPDGERPVVHMFNLSRPQDFEGHSLSVSDVIALKRNGEVSVHYVDSIGFKELPGFLDTKPERPSVLMNLREKCDAPECNPTVCRKARDGHEL